MAQDRKRAREAREAARAAEVAAAAARREKAERRKVLLERVTPAAPRRRKSYGAVPTLVLARAVVLFLAVQAVAWVFLAGRGQRFSVAVLTAAVLTVIVMTRRSYR